MSKVHKDKKSRGKINANIHWLTLNRHSRMRGPGLSSCIVKIALYWINSRLWRNKSPKYARASMYRLYTIPFRDTTKNDTRIDIKLCPRSLKVKSIPCRCSRIIANVKRVLAIQNPITDGHIDPYLWNITPKWSWDLKALWMIVWLMIKISSAEKYLYKMPHLLQALLDF